MLIGAGLLVLMAAALAVSGWFLGFLGGQTSQPGARPSAFATPVDLPPEPRLQVDEAADLAAMHRAEDSALTSYGWVNKDSGLVRVPVARAMELLVKEGLPARGEGALNGKESQE